MTSFRAINRRHYTKMLKTSTFNDKESGRRATAFGYDGSPRVVFFEHNVLVGTRDFPDKTFRYAEDAAENYVNGILVLDAIS